MGKKNNGLKRKAGHMGFQAGEIAFIEDEMAALAAEYGLEVDKDVASHVQQRKQSKKTRRRQILGDANGRQKIENQHLNQHDTGTIRLIEAKRHLVKAEDIEDAHSYVLKRLTIILPDTCALRACGVPGCTCANGSRSLGLQERDPCDKIQYPIENAQCLKCKHGVLQHAIVLREDADLTAALPSGGQRLLQTLFQMIRLARTSASIFKSRMWTKSALERLEGVLTHLKKQYATGGTHNGQKSASQVHEERQLLATLHAQLRKARQTVKSASREKLPIALACICDQMYFQTYYAALVLYGRACDAVPSPEKYFNELERFTPASTSQFEAFLTNELSGPDVPIRVLKSLALPLTTPLSRDKGAQEEKNPLLAIFHARLREGVRLFYEEGVGMDGEMEAVLSASKGCEGAKAQKSRKKSHKKPFRRERSNVAPSDATLSSLEEMPCYPLLAQWRDNCRDWCCHLFAYATPTQEALDVMAKYGPIVEVGAGTGYWSSLLHRAGVDVVAFDKTPPCAEDAQANAYHGRVPPFCSIQRGGPELLGRHDMAKRSLFLCYPPPGDAMAVRCIQLFQGDVVLHVGEWQGDTGDCRFERELQRQFVVVQNVLLPNWGNSAYELTVWRRKATEVEAVAWQATSCFYCDKTMQEALKESESLRRCVVCKTNVYCSSTCARQDALGHAAEHAKRLVFLEEPSSDEMYDRIFDNEAYYRILKKPDLDNTVVAAANNWQALTKKDSDLNTGLDLISNDDGDPIEDAISVKRTAFTFDFGASNNSIRQS